MKYLKLFEDFQSKPEILFMAETKGGRYRIEVYQDEMDKKRNKYSFSEFTNDRETGHSGSYNKAQMNVWLNHQIEGSSKIDGINYIVKLNKEGFDILDIEKDKPYKSYSHYNRLFRIHPSTGEPFDYDEYDRKRNVVEKVKSGREFTDDDRNEVYGEIEMRMRPSDNSLPYRELEDICTNVLMTEPDEDSMSYVVNIMNDYLRDRDEKYKDELSTEVKDCIRFFKEDQEIQPEDLEFENFYDWFKKGGWEDEMVREYTREQVKDEFDKQLHPVDPNQMKLPLE